jgi:hypothetical protein
MIEKNNLVRSSSNSVIRSTHMLSSTYVTAQSKISVVLARIRCRRSPNEKILSVMKNGEIIRFL